MRDKQANELYLPLTSTVVLKRKKEMLYVPVHFEIGLMLEALMDSGAYVSVIAQNDKLYVQSFFGNKAEPLIVVISVPRRASILLLNQVR